MRQKMDRQSIFYKCKIVTTSSQGSLCQSRVACLWPEPVKMTYQSLHQEVLLKQSILTRGWGKDGVTWRHLTACHQGLKKYFVYFFFLFIFILSFVLILIYIISVIDQDFLGFIKFIVTWHCSYWRHIFFFIDVYKTWKRIKKK